MIKFEFNKIFKLSELNKQFFELPSSNGQAKNVLKIILLLLFAPIYLCLVAVTYVMYFNEVLLTIPSKLVHGVRVANTPYDESNKVPYNASYILLYMCVVTFDVLAIMLSWFIALTSLFLDLLGNIVCFGSRNLSAFNICFDNSVPEHKISSKHFWFTILEIVLLVALIFVAGRLATSLATSHETINTGSGLMIVEKIDQGAYNTLNVIFTFIGYCLSTVVITLLYNKGKEQ